MVDKKNIYMFWKQFPYYINTTFIEKNKVNTIQK